MDEVLAKASSQAFTFAIRSGVSLASSFAIKTITKYVSQLPKNSAQRVTDDDIRKLEYLKSKLDTRVNIVSSTIELIRLVAARGNTNLDGVIALTNNLKDDIDSMDEKLRLLTSNDDGSDALEVIHKMEDYIKDVLERIDEVTPYLNLSLTTSGSNLSVSLPKQVSPSLLLQSSNYISESNKLFSNQDELVDVNVGPVFQITLFTIFYKTSTSSVGDVIWKEDIKRANLQVVRRCKKEDVTDVLYDYCIEIDQNFDDTRYHDEEEKKESKKIVIELPQIVKLFFSVSGKLLKLEEMDTPVLVLKVDNNVGKKTSTENITWFAMSGYEEIEVASESESENETEEDYDDDNEECDVSKSIKLLEYLIRLSSLQANDKNDILKVKDERLSVYLNDENPTSIKEVDVDSISNKLRYISLNELSN